VPDIRPELHRKRGSRTVDLSRLKQISQVNGKQFPLELQMMHTPDWVDGRPLIVSILFEAGIHLAHV
jgi:hypothetical protein